MGQDKVIPQRSMLSKCGLMPQNSRLQQRLSEVVSSGRMKKCSPIQTLARRSIMLTISGTTVVVTGDHGGDIRAVTTACHRWPVSRSSAPAPIHSAHKHQSQQTTPARTTLHPGDCTATSPSVVIKRATDAAISSEPPRNRHWNCGGSVRRTLQPDQAPTSDIDVKAITRRGGDGERTPLWVDRLVLSRVEYSPRSGDGESCPQKCAVTDAPFYQQCRRWRSTTAATASAHLDRRLRRRPLVDAFRGPDTGQNWRSEAPSRCKQAYCIASSVVQVT